MPLRKNRITVLLATLICLLAFFLPGRSFGQSYGLAFFSHEVIQDKRTSLNLFPQQPYSASGNFELCFDMSFLPGHKEYFGYVFRVIINDQQSVDLIYEHPDPHFAIIAGEDTSNIRFNIDPTNLYGQWTSMKLRFDLEKDEIDLVIGKQHHRQSGIRLKQGDKFRCYFGASQYLRFRVTDVPPMKIRDIKIIEGGETILDWPLNERKGSFAKEIIHQQHGEILNPTWIKSAHYDWKAEGRRYIKGFPALAFDRKREKLFIAGSDSLYTYDASTGAWSQAAYASGRQGLLTGNQGLYAALDNTLYSIYIDHKMVAALQPDSLRWNKPYAQGPVTDYWHFNKFFSAADTSIYLIGGYGHYQYRNSVFRFHIPSGKFDSIAAGGDRLIPRYLAALGQTDSGDTAYILGGYGSLTGKQVVNPQNLYDLVVFDANSKKFIKRFELEKTKEAFVFANSLVIDKKTNTFYGLTFPNYKYNSSLQLIRGSLVDPAFHEVGSKIPYAFHDIDSYAELYQGQATKQFVAVTLLSDSSEHTLVQVYTLQFPPEADDPAENVIPVKTANRKGLYFLLFIPALFIVYIFIRKRSKNTKSSTPAVVIDTTPTLTAADPVQNEIPKPEKSSGPAILLFGEMQVIDREGNDITRLFTPLIKELFLIILLYTLKKGRGISSEKLTEILWFDKSTQSARNNRSVNIAKLKTILERLGETGLSKDTGYWKLEFNYDEIRIDLYQYLQIVRNKETLNKPRLLELSQITQSGNFLANVEYEWLDAFKSELSNEIIDTYLHFVESVRIADDPEFIIRIAQYIFSYDPVNEEAMIMKCKALAQLGKHTLAKNTFDNFTREYNQIYGEDFRMNFKEVIGE